MASAMETEKAVVMVGIDESEESFYALQWTLDHLFTPYAPSSYPFKLMLVSAKSPPHSAIGLTGPGAVDVVTLMDKTLLKAATRVVDRAKDLCHSKNVNDVIVKIVEGDARNVLCEAVEKYHPSMLVVGSHGYGAIKRAVLGSVSDYCAHHARCSVLIVKKPEANNKH